MQQRSPERRVFAGPAFGLARAVLLALGLCAVASLAAADETTANRAAPGMRLYRDPATGRVGAPPPGVSVDQVAPALRAAQSDRAPAVNEVLEPGPGGGTRVRLSGRHRAVVRRDANSAGASHECVDGGASADE